MYHCELHQLHPEPYGNSLFLCVHIGSKEYEAPFQVNILCFCVKLGSQRGLGGGYAELSKEFKESLALVTLSLAFGLLCSFTIATPPIARAAEYTQRCLSETT